MVFRGKALKVASTRIPEILKTLSTLGLVMKGERYEFKTFVRGARRLQVEKFIVDTYRAIAMWALSPYHVWCPMETVSRVGITRKTITVTVEIAEETHVPLTDIPLVKRVARYARDPNGLLVAVMAPKGAGKTSAIATGRLDVFDDVYDSDFFYYFNTETKSIPYSITTTDGLEQYWKEVSDGYSKWSSQVYTTMRGRHRLQFVHFESELAATHASKFMTLCLLPAITPRTAMFYRMSLPHEDGSYLKLPYGTRVSIEDYERVIKENSTFVATLEDLVVMGLVLRKARAGNLAELGG
jgi:hypothetical protein